MIAKLVIRPLLILNLVLAFTGAFRVFPSWHLENRLLRHAFDVYGYITSTARHHGFFAPGVVSTLRVDYSLLQDNIEIKSGNFNDANLEVKHRLGNLLNRLWLSDGEMDLRRSIAASLAAKVFTLENSPAKKGDQVMIKVKAYVLPTLQDYKKGELPSWETNYQAYFTSALN